ncbi:MAG: amino acid permease [Saprospiraceae bacterium]|nr:amino acid permease [Saprospiraceae bacterium]MCF8249124.1 amino acid permease [Saprospiraceae bacterium]MCF8281381.1 amino acid permease [Bacteroidales bacterium]MCF8311146.1 amino acid permease [Saprospiraceae bacterium]MCF8440236.1 amino acid permease [Saprospiraceae bacterium]
MKNDKTLHPFAASAVSANETGAANTPPYKKAPIKFGMFQGVFTPTLLTILGVIMFLRGPWVVGNAGVLGAIGIITLATVITLFTSLSMSSIVTNIRIKAGGAFSIIAQSLGLEAGGAIGIPLYIAQAFAVAMYVFGFREGWLWVFPTHPALLVDLAIFAFIFIIANISTDFAFKIQYLVLAIILLSIVSIGMGFLTHPVNLDVRWLGNYEGSQENGFSGSNFWIVFAVYFPAVTGIMAGANMSGDLKDPRSSIPVGTLAAVGLSYFVYVGMAILVAFLATPQELLENYNILIDKSYFAPLVVAGLLGATFSSALASLVGAPRILQALGQNNILFMNKKLASTDKKGEPKFALYFTTVIVLLSLLLRDLNAIAPLLTMFFLITYAMINVVVLVEQGLGQISFRPTLKVPIIVPLLGAIGCFFVMFIINATVGLVSIALVLAMYVYLSKQKNLETEEGDTRSGMFNSLAEWSAKVVSRLPEASERAWQPNLLVPAQTINDVVRCYKSLYNLSRPKGSVKILGFDTGNSAYAKKMRERLPELCDYFMEQNISASSAMVEAESFRSGVLTCMQGLMASFFTPNTLFLSLTDETDRDEDFKVLIDKARQYGLGSYLYMPYKKVGLGLEKTLNLWLDLRHLDFDVEHKIEDKNLGLLTAYLLHRNWKGKLNFIAKLDDTIDEEVATAFLKKLSILARIPNAQMYFVQGNAETAGPDAPHADLNILIMKPGEVDMDAIRRRIDALETSCLFTMDGGGENALA